MMSSIGRPGCATCLRHVELVHELVVAEHQIEVLVDQDDAVVHVVEDGLHHRAGALDVLLGGGQRLLALLQLGDIAVNAEHAAVRQRVVGELDVAAAQRAALVAVRLSDRG